MCLWDASFSTQIRVLRSGCCALPAQKRQGAKRGDRGVMWGLRCPQARGRLSEAKPGRDPDRLLRFRAKGFFPPRCCLAWEATLQRSIRGIQERASSLLSQLLNAPQEAGCDPSQTPSQQELLLASAFGETPAFKRVYGSLWDPQTARHAVPPGFCICCPDKVLTL